MKKSVFFGTVALVALVAGAASASTLDDVKARGQLICGVNPGLTGFGAPDANGNYQGFDVAACKAVAAAVLGDPMKVQYKALTGETRFTALASGEVDMLARNSTWTFGRDTELALDFVAVNYYDGQGFMVNKSLGVSSAKELDGATVCVQTGTTTEMNLADYFKSNNMTYTPVNIADDAEGQQKFLAGACDSYTTDASGLAASRATMPNAADIVILPEIISKEPLALAVRHGDNNWGDIVRWSFYALVAAEEYGITKANLEEVAASTQNPEIRRLLGLEGDMGKKIGLDNDFAKRAIMASGNYGEIFEANIGASTSIGLARGLNAQWTQGGLMYAPPFR
ncbi:L-glutamine-binding protein /L-glutamate-binding protein /L-aspartate-binding protein /L-asparagine-binding protein [Rhodobacter viridis]|uniref:L-glutamine-binding protein /L-glutamate-binding protein /L-aspartate-binding protein /L-asparagine-binding protein n=1 Tax=Rhodobacter viridis TaxID=1054202 RepID=A0A318UE95_9RHOB|nr:amino acid ABC transporter substrate-binding protein [Rhodobacter viridis]PYF10999.1 L-glutamine-binding protein /L-glutamate-binding protein /L-aspartate-binding protein /L-asparagine-binding protein [Rhodobacter viridis]